MGLPVQRLYSELKKHLDIQIVIMRIMFNIIRYINLLYSFQPNNYSNLIERIGFPIDIKK